MLSIDPLFPLPLLIFFCILILYFMIRSFKKLHVPNKLKWQLLTLKIISFSILLTFALQPAFEKRLEVLHKKKLFFLIDDSDSMTIRDMPSRETRRAFAELLLQQNNHLITGLEKNLEIVEIFFGRNTAFNSKDVNRAFTALGDALSHIIRGVDHEEIAGVILLTDGQSNIGTSINSVLAEYKRKKVPIHSFPLGRDRYNSDVIDGRVEKLSCPSSIKSKEILRLKVSVDIKGKFKKTPRLKVYIDGHEVSDVAYSGEREILFDLSMSDFSVGFHRLEVRLDCGTQEITPQNNTSSTYFEIQEGGISVLLIATSPSADFKFLSRYLKKAANIEAIIPSPYLYRTSKGQDFLKKLDLASLDLIIFQNPNLDYLPESFLSDCQESFKLRKQGIIFQGPKTLSEFKEHQQLLDYLPVISSEETVATPAKKLDVPITYRSHFVVRPLIKDIKNIQFSGLSREIVDSRFSKVLVKHDEIPILLVSSLLKSKSAWINSNALWQLNTSETSKVVYNELLKRLIDFLISRDEKNTSQLLIYTDKTNYMLSEDVRLYYKLMAEDKQKNEYNAISIKVSSIEEEIKQQSVGLNQGYIDLDFDRTGLFSIKAHCDNGRDKLVSNNLKLFIDSPQIEFDHILANKAMLKKLSELTQGTFLQNQDDFSKVLSSYSQNSSVFITHKTINKSSLWDNEFSYILICLFLSLEWYLRRKLKAS